MSIGKNGIWKHNGTPNENLLDNTPINPTTFSFTQWNTIPYVYNLSDLNIATGDTVTLSGYLQVDATSATHCALAIEWYNDDNNRVQYPSVYVEPGSESYCKVSQTLPANYASGKIRIRIQSGAATAGAGTYWKIKLEKGNVATSWTPKNSDVLFTNNSLHSFIENSNIAKIQKNDYIEANSFIEI